MIKSSFSLILIVFFSFNTFAQVDEIEVQGISLSAIRGMIADNEGVYYYPTLIKTFQEEPKSLRKIDFLMLYYGYVFTDEYDPYAHFALEDSLSSLNEQQKFIDALLLGDSLLAMNPVSVFGNIQKAIALSGLNREEEAQAYLEKYRILVEAFESSGRGDAYENPIVIITPKDAQAILFRYQLTELSKTLNGKGIRYFDVYLVRNAEEKQYPIYFDVTLPRLIGMEKLKKNLSEH
jgi:hypothetical protein